MFHQKNRRLLGVLALLIGSFCLLPGSARASHAFGSDMYYVNVAPGIYFVAERLYRDCSGIPAPADLTLTYSATGCASAGGSNGGGMLTLRHNSYSDGNPYCPAVNAQSPCDSASSVPGLWPNYQIYNYSGLLALGTDSTVLCSEWMLSTSVNARPEVANLAAAQTLHSFMLLNNRDLTSDSSPSFSIMGGMQPLIVMCDSTAINYNSAVIDGDGDSLVYSLAPAYSEVPGPGTQGQCIYAGGYTYQQPVRTLAGSAPLAIDPTTGALTLTAGTYVPNSRQDYENKFVVVIQVDAYRRLGGQVIHTSTVRRDVAVIIVNCQGASSAPQQDCSANSITVTAGGSTQTYSCGDIIPATEGVPMTIRTTLFDVNQDSITVSPTLSVLPSGATLATTPAGAGIVTVTLSWTPPVGGGRSQPYWFFLRAADNGCPLPQVSWHSIGVSLPVQRPTGLAAEAATAPATAAPNPFSTEARLTLTTGATTAPTALLIYDATGRQVDQLSVPAGPAGVRTLTWQPRAALAAGLYYARYAAPGQRRQTLVLQKQ